MTSPGYLIDVVVTKLAKARVKDAYGTGKHKCYLAEAVPVEFTTPDPAKLDEQQSEKLTTAEKIKVRNTFDDELPVGAELIIQLGADGIGKILVWPCDE